MDYAFPPDVESSARDFKMSWWLAQELGVAAIPPSGSNLETGHSP